MPFGPKKNVFPVVRAVAVGVVSLSCVIESLGVISGAIRTISFDIQWSIRVLTWDRAGYAVPRKMPLAFYHVRDCAGKLTGPVEARQRGCDGRAAAAKLLGLR